MTGACRMLKDGILKSLALKMDGRWVGRLSITGQAQQRATS